MIKALTLFPNTIESNELEEILSTIVLTIKDADGLHSLKISKGHVMSPGGPPPFSKVLEMSFESLELFMAWVETPAAQASKDIFTDSNIVRLFYEVVDL